MSPQPTQRSNREPSNIRISKQAQRERDLQRAEARAAKRSH